MIVNCVLISQKKTDRITTTRLSEIDTIPKWSRSIRKTILGCCKSERREQS